VYTTYSGTDGTPWHLPERAAILHAPAAGRCRDFRRGHKQVMERHQHAGFSWLPSFGSATSGDATRRGNASTIGPGCSCRFANGLGPRSVCWPTTASLSVGTNTGRLLPLTCGHCLSILLYLQACIDTVAEGIATLW